jgi:type IV pilus assembly protein PilM
MAEQNPGVWGIDIGQCALKAVRLELEENQVTATAFDYVEHPKILSQPDADPDQLTREALEKFLSRNTLRGDSVAISVPGQSGLARFVKLPPVEEKKIPDIVRFEAKQQIPFPLDEVVWDYQKIGSGNVTDGFAMETEIGLFAIKRDMVNRALQQFKDVDVEVHIVQMAPLALCNYLAFDILKKGGPAGAAARGEAEETTRTSEKHCVVALDIGTDNSNLVITDGERIIWQRPIPFGGNHFTRALTKDMKLTFAKAEHLKRNATKSPDLKKILTSLKPVLNDFAGEVQRSLGYFTNTHRNAHVDYMVGLGNAFRLPGLQKFLSEKLQIDVRKVQKFNRLSGDTVLGGPAFTQNILSFAPAYGLALQGLNLAKLTTNLLPQDIQFERMIRSKKPWAVAAAACLLVGVMAGSINYALQYRAVAAPSVFEEIDKSMKEVVKPATEAKNNYTAKDDALKKKENDVRNIIAGQEERLNWILLNEYINESLPIPGKRLEGKVKSVDGKGFIVTDREGRDFPTSNRPLNLTTTSVFGPKGQITRQEDLKVGEEITVIYNDSLSVAAARYWDNGARDAYRKVSERQTPIKGPDGRTEEDKIDSLIQVNIESIYPLYCNDLKAYFTQLKDDLKQTGKKLDLMLTKDEMEKDPEGKGWVIEIRGYTYHKDPYEFLLDTFHQNLQKRGAKVEKKEGTPAPTVPPAAQPGDKPVPTLALTPEQEKSKLWEKVIAGRISHVVLYDYTFSQSADVAGNFVLINGSVVGRLVGGQSGTTRGPGGGEGGVGLPGGGDPLSPATASGGGGTPISPGTSGGGGKGGNYGNWTPLTGIDAGGGSSSGPGALAGSTSDRPMLSKPGGGTSSATLEGGGPSKPASGDTPAKLGPKRAEFIMLLVWKEPTPSDDRKEDSSGGQSQTGSTSQRGG